MSETQESRGSSPIVRVAIASWIDTSIEWYDFFLYATAAALVLGPLFFSPKLSPLAAQLSASFSKADFLTIGWRIPFLLSIVLVAIGLFIRLRIAETPDFERVKETHVLIESLEVMPFSIRI